MVHSKVFALFREKKSSRSRFLSLALATAWTDKDVYMVFFKIVCLFKGRVVVLHVASQFETMFAVFTKSQIPSLSIHTSDCMHALKKHFTSIAQTVGSKLF